MKRDFVIVEAANIVMLSFPLKMTIKMSTLVPGAMGPVVQSVRSKMENIATGKLSFYSHLEGHFQYDVTMTSQYIKLDNDSKNEHYRYEAARQTPGCFILVSDSIGEVLYLTHDFRNQSIFYIRTINGFGMMELDQ